MLPLSNIANCRQHKRHPKQEVGKTPVSMVMKKFKDSFSLFNALGKARASTQPDIAEIIGSGGTYEVKENALTIGQTAS